MLDVQRADTDQPAIGGDQCRTAPKRMRRCRKDRPVEDIFPIAGEFLARHNPRRDRVATPALGRHNGAIPGADPHADAQFQRLDIQLAECLDQPKPGFLIVGKNVSGHRATASRGQPNGLGFGDQVADRQDEAIAADQDPAPGALGAKRGRGKSVIRNRCPKAEHCTEGAVEIKVAVAGLWLDLARDLPFYVSRHCGNSFVAPTAIITRNGCGWFVFFCDAASHHGRRPPLKVKQADPDRGLTTPGAAFMSPALICLRVLTIQGRGGLHEISSIA